MIVGSCCDGDGTAAEAAAHRRPTVPSKRSPLHDKPLLARLTHELERLEPVREARLRDVPAVACRHIGVVAGDSTHVRCSRALTSALGGT